MKLKKIQMQGFKSFADLTEVEVRDGVTAIVGPNGSGKSNIVDAIRWVLGEQSVKTLRGAKSQDIIFSGTKFRKGQAFAEVSIIFDNSSGLLPIDYDEVKITRKLYRDGESGYYINGSKVRLKTVQELFMDTGIGKDGYSIIGQGRIDEILSNNSDERRKVFEEATGIVKYRERKKETLKNIDNTNINLVRINDILDEVTTNLGSLKVQSEKAIRYTELKDDKEKIDLRIFKENICIFDEKIKKSKLELSNVLKDIESKNSVISELQNELTIISDIISQIDKKSETGYETISNILKEISEKEKEHEINLEKIKNIKENISNNIKEIESLKSKIVIKKEDVLSKKEKKKRNEKGFNTFKEMLKEKENLLANKKKILDASKGDITEKKEAKEKIKDEIYEVDNDIYKKGLAIDNFKGRMEMLKSELNSSKLKLDKKRMMIEDETNKFKKENKENILRIKELEKQKNDIQEKQAEKEKMRFKLADLKNEILMLEKEKQINENLEKEKEGFSYAVKQILKQKNANSQIGSASKGVVADLINVDEKYSSAIQTALGYSMQNIVVETSDDADLIIDYLKKNKSGRATFLPVNSFSKYNTKNYNSKKEELKRKISSVGFDVIIAADIVSIDSYYAPIINFILKDTVIVKEMKEAITLSKILKNTKIVTLSGDVINSSGSITGGYTNKKLNILDRKNQIKKLEKEISKRKAELSKLEKKFNVNAKLEEDSNNLKIIDSELSKKQVDLKVKEEKLLNEVKAKKDLENIIININQDISKLNEEILLAKSEEKKMIDIKNLLKEKLTEIEAEETKLLNANKDSNLAEEIEDISEEIMDLKISVGSFEENEKSLNEIIDIIQSEINNIEFEIKEKEESIKQGNDNIIKLSESIEMLKLDIDKLEKDSLEVEGVKQEIKKEREDAFLKEKKIKDSLNELNEMASKLVTLKLENEQKLYKEELKKDNLINNIWNEYNITYSNIKIDQSDEVYTKNKLNTLDIEGNIIDFNIIKAKKISDELSRKIASLGSVNLDSIEEYKALKERHTFLTNQKRDLDETKKSLQEVIKNVSSTMEEQFVERLKLINENFKEVFTELFGGGKALITLEDEKRPLESGVEIKVEPPGKKLQSLSLLSGGERAFTAIAILFAILKLNPSPFSVLDEIEAALDDANVQRFANYLNKYVEDSQFIVITHRKGTMASSKTIYGVTMEEKGISKLVSLDLNEVKKR